VTYQNEDDHIPNHRVIILEALQVAGRQHRAVGRPEDLFPSIGRHGCKGPGITPIGQIRRNRRKRNVARDEHDLGEYRGFGTERLAYLRGAFERELIGDRKPAEGGAVIAEFRGIDVAVETPSSGFRIRRLYARHYLDRTPARVLEVAGQHLAAGTGQLGEE